MARDTDLGCLSIKVTFKAMHWMVEITQEESVTKTESWDAPTVRDLTEGEEDSEEGTERAHSKRNGGENDVVKFLKEGIISASFMERMLSI